MPKSKYVRAEEDDLVLRAPDGTEKKLVGVQRMHFYRLAGVTLEDATDEQVERYFALQAQEAKTGHRTTPVRKSESAADMVARELKILNLPQLLQGDQAALETPNAPSPPPTTAPASPSEPSSARQPSPRPAPSIQPSREGLPPAPRYRPGEGLPPPPRYRPQTAPGPAAAPGSRFLRQEGAVLFLQAPDGTEQRVTQYMRVHFARMLEKDIAEATDQDVEMWWKLQGSMDPGTTLPEAQSQNLLTEALKAAGKLKRAELEVLHQTISTWLEARREG